MAKKRYGRWQIEKSLDEGGQGHLYLVTNTLKQKGGGLYVLKRLKDSNRLERFKQEIDVTERLKRLKVIQIEDYWLDGGKPYYVMEY